ncbi:interleukin-18 receptor 1-like isoform X2 [Genypterus blacodes]|uniref:interleukin-18 receptor 1-like isoform X2 n=1 Tax=Genypterus blacodes TaxID=154954 RepID=UPI003F76EEDB
MCYLEQTAATARTLNCCVVMMLEILLMLSLPVVHQNLMKAHVLCCEGVCPERVVFVKEGDMVSLRCRAGGANVTWTGPSVAPETEEIRNKSEAVETLVLLHQRSLVLLRASLEHQGVYVCSVGDSSSSDSVNLTVLTRESECDSMSCYPHTCSIQESCRLKCPKHLHLPHLTSTSTTWYKAGQSRPVSSEESYHFPSVRDADSGVYSCVRSYLYDGRLYNMTRTTELDVEADERSGRNPVIVSPQANQLFSVDLDSHVEIDCKAVLYSDGEEVHWLTDNTFVENNDSFPVYYMSTRQESRSEMTASLVLQKVSKEDLLKNYTCKLESPMCQRESPSYSNCSVTVFLVPKDHPSHVSMVLWLAGVVVLMVVSLLIYVKLKIEIVLLLRDTLGCFGRSSDGKSYDAYLMYYKCERGAGLCGGDRKWLENVLEERFGYNICLFHRDVLPGEAAAEAVLQCIQKSRTLVLIPTCGDSDPGSALLSAIHEALVERQIHLVWITAGTAAEPGSVGSVPEALQRLGRAEHSVAWRGLSSWSPSSSFWKQLRFHLPAPQRSGKMAAAP